MSELRPQRIIKSFSLSQSDVALLNRLVTRVEKEMKMPVANSTIVRASLRALAALPTNRFAQLINDVERLMPGPERKRPIEPLTPEEIERILMGVK